MGPALYTGYKVIEDSDPRLAELYSDKAINWFDLLENQYLIVKRSDGTVADKFKWQNGKHVAVYKKPLESRMFGKIEPKNIEQQLAIDALMDERTTVKVLSGCFGSGKDFLMCACAFDMVRNGKFDSVMWVRNNVEVKDTKPIGFLPGEESAKLSVWAGPLADHVGGMDELELMQQRGSVSIEHLGFLRGRDIRNTIIYCSEAENLTRSHVQLLLGRVGEGSILFLNGDWRQMDARAFEKDNGLTAAIDRLKGNRLFSYVHLSETVRSETAKLADLLDN